MLVHYIVIRHSDTLTIPTSLEDLSVSACDTRRACATEVTRTPRDVESNKEMISGPIVLISVGDYLHSSCSSVNNLLSHPIHLTGQRNSKQLSRSTPINLNPHNEASNSIRCPCSSYSHLRGTRTGPRSPSRLWLVFAEILHRYLDPRGLQRDAHCGSPASRGCWLYVLNTVSRWRSFLVGTPLIYV